MIRLDVSFEGANPHTPGDAAMVSDETALIRPWSEDGDGNYKFLLNVAMTNDGHNEKPITLHIDWQDTEYMDVRDYVMIGRDESWQAVPGQVSGSVTTVSLTVPPGVWRLSLQPTYDPPALDAACRQAVTAGLSQRVIGRSQHGRPIVALQAGPADAPTIFITARFHPYETAGSFCAAGILDMLAADLASTGPLTRQFRFVIVPMANPDGVALGCPKRSRQGGPDIAHEQGEPADPAWLAVAGLLEETRPQGFFDFHGWMYRNDDGLCFSDEDKCRRWQAIVAAEPAFDKRWKTSYRDWPLRPGDFYSRAHRLCGAFTLLPSISWFGRTTSQVRRIGRTCLRAMCDILRQ